MNLTEEIITLLRKAKDTNEYFNPWILEGICNALVDGDPDIAEDGIPDDIDNWVNGMWSR